MDREQLLARVESLEQELQQRGASAEHTEQELVDFFSLSMDLLVVAGADGYYKRVNPAFTKLLGFTEQELLERPFMEFIHPDDRDHAREYMAKLLEGETLLDFEDRNICKDGSHRWISWHVTPDLEQGVVYGVGRDITARTEALRRSEERFQTLAESIDAVVWTAEVHSNEDLRKSALLYANPAIEQMTGLPMEAFHTSDDQWFRLVHPDDQHTVERAFKLLTRDGRMECEYRLVRPDGTVRWVLDRTWIVSTDVRGVVRTGGLITDITARRLAEDALREKDRQIRQAQKLEAVGLLAGGVAHEYNNILQVIQGYMHLAVQEVRDQPKVMRFVKRSLKAVDRAASLTTQLLSFSRRQSMSMGYLNPNKVIADHTSMIKPLIGEQIQLEVAQGQEIGTVYADQGQLQQVLLNLCLNARDAMPEGGRLTINTERVELPTVDPPSPPVLPDQPHIVICISDTGCGMSPEVQRQIFDPFFTTKEVGQGTGLGLATAYGIIKQHDGTITVQSAPGEGTTFRIYLPVHERHADVDSDRPEAMGEGGHEGILVAEDEPMILDLAVLILRDAGYRTFVARDGVEALRVFNANADEISLALLDVMMPKVSGRAVFEQLKLMRKDARALFCTGHDPEVSEVRALLADGQPLIRKPFTPQELLLAVREALDG